jgi:hypothetical protein
MTRADVLPFPRRRAQRPRPASPSHGAVVLPFIPRPAVAGDRDSPTMRRTRSSGVSMTLSIDTAALMGALLARMAPRPPRPPRPTTSRRRR